MEQALAAQDPALLLAELEACQARLRQSQAACGSKDATVRELRERLEQQTRYAGGHLGKQWCMFGWGVGSSGGSCIWVGMRLDRLFEPKLCPSSTACVLLSLSFRLAHEQGMLEEREQQQAAVARLVQQLADREAQVDELHQQLRQLYAELAAASEGVQASAASHSAAAEGAAARLEAAGRCTQLLVQAVRLLLETLAQLGSAVAAAAGRQPVHDTSLQVGRKGLVGTETVVLQPCCLHGAAYTPSSMRRQTLRRLRQQPAALLAWWAWMQTT